MSEKISPTALVVAAMKQYYGNYNQQVSNLLKANNTVGGYIHQNDIQKAQEMGLFIQSRTLSMEKLLKEEVDKHASILEIGGGLNFRNFNHKNYIISDLQNIINTRKKVSSGENLKIIDITSEHLERNLSNNNTLFIAEGVFPYFSKEQLQLALGNIHRYINIHGGKLIFDIATQQGLDYSISTFSPASSLLLSKFYSTSGIERRSLACESFDDIKEILQKIGFQITTPSFSDCIGIEILGDKKYSNIEDNIRKKIMKTPLIICSI